MSRNLPTEEDLPLCCGGVCEIEDNSRWEGLVFRPKTESCSRPRESSSILPQRWTNNLLRNQGQQSENRTSNGWESRVSYELWTDVKFRARIVQRRNQPVVQTVQSDYRMNYSAHHVDKMGNLEGISCDQFSWICPRSEKEVGCPLGKSWQAGQWGEFTAESSSHAIIQEKCLFS